MLTGFLLLINVLFFGVILSSFFLTAAPGDVVSALGGSGFYAVKITFVSAIVTSLVNIVLGIPAAFIIARKNELIYRIIDLITIIPIVIPPSVAGLALLITFGRKGILAEVLFFLEINLAFTFAAVIIAQVFVTLPIFIQVMKSGFKAIDREIEEAAKMEGAGETELLFYFYLPLSVKFLVTGVVLSILRAAGEFGATIMFAGNLPGKTQTLTTAIYTLSEYNLAQAVALALVLIVLFLIPLALHRIYQTS